MCLWSVLMAESSPPFSFFLSSPPSLSLHLPPPFSVVLSPFLQHWALMTDDVKGGNKIQETVSFRKILAGTEKPNMVRTEIKEALNTSAVSVSQSMLIHFTTRSVYLVAVLELLNSLLSLLGLVKLFLRTVLYSVSLIFGNSIWQTLYSCSCICAMLWNFILKSGMDQKSFQRCQTHQVDFYYLLFTLCLIYSIVHHNYLMFCNYWRKILKLIVIAY